MIIITKNSPHTALLSSIIIAANILFYHDAISNAVPVRTDSKCDCDESLINRQGFPQGFIFGSGSASYQVEGAYNVSGKGLSMWDHFTHTYPEKIQDRTNGDVAADSYHLYKEDVQLIKNMGMEAYKFSISWPRILPGGTVDKGVNQGGIDYYNNLIDELLDNGIQPWVTLLHLDTPHALEDEYGGFLNSKIIDDFRDFAEVLFERFGDRVKHWITINEPWCLSYLGYTLGVFAPGRCSAAVPGTNGCLGGDPAVEPYVVTHNQILAHASVVELYRNKYQKSQKGRIGITLNSFYFVPYDETNESLNARDRAFAFMLGWIMDPITFGRYPEIIRARVGSRLPQFTEEEADMVKGSFDFLGLNYYSSIYSVDTTYEADSYMKDTGYSTTAMKDGVLIGEQSSNGSRYYSYPKGLRELLSYIKHKYNDPLIYITENGLDENRNDSLPMSEALKDGRRKNYLYDHLCCLREAIQKDGANVRGYFAWSLTDNYEWASGYLIRFGIHYVDFFNDKSLRRYPKSSALWLKSILASRKTDQKPRGTIINTLLADH